MVRPLKDALHLARALQGAPHARSTRLELKAKREFMHVAFRALDFNRVEGDYLEFGSGA